VGIARIVLIPLGYCCYCPCVRVHRASQVSCLIDGCVFSKVEYEDVIILLFPWPAFCDNLTLATLGFRQECTGSDASYRLSRELLRGRRWL